MVLYGEYKSWWSCTYALQTENWVTAYTISTSVIKTGVNAVQPTKLRNFFV